MDVQIGSADPHAPSPGLLADAARRRPPAREPATPPAAIDGHAARDGKRPPIELVLYVSSMSAHSTIALRNLRRALAQHAGTRVKLTVHDLSKDPQRAEHDGVHFTPALVTTGAGPRTWIVGHLGNPQVLQALLESAFDVKE